MPVQSVKSFRAAVFQRENGDSSVLVPSKLFGRYTIENLVCILDVEPGDVSCGRMTLTPESIEAWNRLKDQRQPVEENGGGKKKTGVKKPGKTGEQRKGILQRLRQKMHAAAKVGRSKNIPHPYKDDGVVVAEEFRRNSSGRLAMKKAIVSACELELLCFPLAPSFDQLSGACMLKSLKDYQYSEFMSHIPAYFQYKYVKIRNGPEFGRRVFNDIQQLFKELRSHPPVRKSFVALIHEVHSMKLEGRIDLE